MKPENRYYQILEIEPGASKAEIKQAYRDLTLVWHPDRFFDNLRLRQKAEEKLKLINSAYEFLNSYQPQAVQVEVELDDEQPFELLLNCEKLESLLELGKLKDADLETKRLLLELSSREKEGWLRPEDVEGLPLEALFAIDQLWIKHSNGRFGFSIQSKIWRKLGCSSSPSTPTQTLSENKFGRSVQWRVGSTWLSPWDAFDYNQQARLGSLPKEYIFALSGWQSYLKGGTGYLLWRFDEIFQKL